MPETTEQTPEEVSPVVTGDISEVTEKLEELKEVMSEEKEPEKIMVNDTEMTEQEILAEMLMTMQGDPEQQQMVMANAETEIDLLQQILNALESHKATVLENQEIAQQHQEQLVEGNFFIGLSVVIAFAVYMFWNQLSKW